MKILIIAAILSIELVFDNFHNINLLPSFIFVSVLVLGQTEEFTVSSQVVVAETVIVGQVPNTFFSTGFTF